MTESEAHAHPVPYKTFIKVWFVLLALTAGLVAVSELGGEAAAVWAMLTFTPIKAGLVFYYFMHLKYESTLLKGMVLVALGTLVIFIGFMFFDVGFRY